MNYNIEYETFLLPEWVNERSKSQAVLRLIGSFLDYASLKLSVLFTNSGFLDHFAQHLYSNMREISHNQFTIELVFLPITVNPKANFLLKTKLNSLVGDDHTEYGQERLIAEIITIAERSLAERRMKVKELMDCSSNLVSVTASNGREPVHRKNKYLFGDLTARFLQHISIFPQIEFMDRIFHGIPINFTPETFSRNIIFQDILNPLSV